MTATPKKPWTEAARPRATVSPAEVIAGLVNAAAAGDQRAWNRLVQEFGTMIWAIARAHRLRDADAADVSQATWLALLQHLKRLNDPARVGAWLATTARRECLRVLRGGERRVLFGDDCPEHESPEPRRRRCAARHRARRRAVAQLLSAPGERSGAAPTADSRSPPPYEEISAALDMPDRKHRPNPAARARAAARAARQRANAQPDDRLTKDEQRCSTTARPISPRSGSASSTTRTWRGSAPRASASTALHAWFQRHRWGRRETAYSAYRAALDREEASARDLERAVALGRRLPWPRRRATPRAWSE